MKMSVFFSFRFKFWSLKVMWRLSGVIPVSIGYLELGIRGFNPPTPPISGIRKNTYSIKLELA